MTRLELAARLREHLALIEDTNAALSEDLSAAIEELKKRCETCRFWVLHYLGQRKYLGCSGGHEYKPDGTGVCVHWRPKEDGDA